MTKETLKVRLVFKGWEYKGVPLQRGDALSELTQGNLDWGNAFDGEIVLDSDDVDTLIAAIHKGCKPIFEVRA